MPFNRPSASALMRAALPNLREPELPQPFTPEWLNGLSEDERKSPEIHEFMMRLHDSGAEYVTWFTWHYQSKHLWTPLMALTAQGSAFFLDCGRGPFGVTAGHVYEAFIRHRATQRMRGYQLANIPFDLEKRLIACGTDRGIDIATFQITPEEIGVTGKKIIKATDGAWPPPPDANDAIFFAGFPGCERDRISSDEFVLGTYSATPRLTSFTEHQLCSQFEREAWRDLRGIGLPPVGYNLGGISGGPMLQPIFIDGIWDWRLIGVVSEAVSVEGFERVTAVRSHFILPDGNLSKI